MMTKHKPLKSRRFGWVDARRAGICLVTFLLAGACYWYFLPSIQSLILPRFEAGENGPWLVRPILAFRFAAAATLLVATLPFLLKPLKRLWAEEDEDAGSRFDALAKKSILARVLLLLKASVLMLIYEIGAAVYLFSWTVIGPEGVEERLPWTTFRHSFEEIQSLQTIPDGERSESLLQNGPWFSVKFKSGRSITLGADSEGCTPAMLDQITRFIAERSGLDWERRSDARPRNSQR